jgi:D-hexose-6-phosphate mutarotase
MASIQSTALNGLEAIRIRTSLAEARIAMHGAHVTHFEPSGEQPVLFLSRASHFAIGKAIRGGVPVIFPWFGPRSGHPQSPSHGFGRTRLWTLEAAEELPSGEVTVMLRLDADAASQAVWPGAWTLRHRVTVGRTLTMALELENCGDAPLVYEDALHTYIAVSEVQQVEVLGLEGGDYLDKTEGQRRKQQPMAPVRFTGEVDRTYLNTPPRATIVDPGWQRRIVVEKEGAGSTVVWNPWIEKAAALADLGDQEWTQFVCVETGNIADNTITLAPGAVHTSTTRVWSEALA